MMLGRGWWSLQGALSPKGLVEPTSVCGFLGDKRSSTAEGSVTAQNSLPLFGTVLESRSLLP